MSAHDSPSVAAVAATDVDTIPNSNGNGNYIHQLNPGFPLFPQFPPEIRNKIWEEALPPPRILTFTVFEDMNGVGSRPGQPRYSQPLGVKVPKTPAVLQSCKEARALFVDEVSSKSFGIRKSSAIKLDATREIVYLKMPLTLAFKTQQRQPASFNRFPGRWRSMRSLSNVKHLAVYSGAYKWLIAWAANGFFREITKISVIVSLESATFDSVEDLEIFDGKSMDRDTCWSNFNFRYGNGDTSWNLPRPFGMMAFQELHILLTVFAESHPHIETTLVVPRGLKLA